MMATRYTYEAIAADGRRVSGELEADGTRTVAEQLHRSGSFPIDIRESGNARSLPHSGVRSGGRSGARSTNAARRLGGTQTTALLRELALLVGAGLPLAPSLEIIASDTSNPGIRATATALFEALGDGKTFHEALQQRPDDFDDFVVNMVRVGEASGTLPAVLDRIAEARERDQRLRAKLLSALMYPAFLIVTAFGAIAVMLGFVVPSFKTLLLNARVEPPPETQLIIAVSDWLTANGLSLAAVLLAGAAGIIALSRSRSGRRTISAWLLQAPVVGRLARLDATIRFFRGLATLLECKVELPRALELLRELFHGHKLGPHIAEAYEALRKGRDFTVPLESSGLFQPVAISLLRTGQETANLPEVSTRIANIAEERFETSVQRTFAVLEPVIILLVSLFVAGIIISVIGAVISVNDLII